MFLDQDKMCIRFGYRRENAVPHANSRSAEADVATWVAADLMAKVIMGHKLKQKRDPADPSLISLLTTALQKSL
jgi:hypothetical protein